MKKSIIISLLLVCILALTIAFTGCDGIGGQGTDNQDTLANQSKILQLVKDYSPTETKGFDYTLEQKYKGSVVNSHSISLRLGIQGEEKVGERIESTKELNEDISKGLYTEKSATTYYKNGQVATYQEESWNLQDCSLEEFAKIKLSSFTFDLASLSNVALTEEGGIAVLRFSLPDNKTADFLGIEKEVKDLTFEIKTSTDFKTLVSFAMSYFQTDTTTTFTLSVYTGSVNITVPQ